MRLLSGRQRGSEIAPERDYLALDSATLGDLSGDLKIRVASVASLKKDPVSDLAEYLDRSELVINSGDNDVSVIGIRLLANDGKIAIEDASVDHRVAANLEREVIAASKHRRWDGEHLTCACLGDNRIAGADGGEEGYLDRTRRLVGERDRTRASGIAMDQSIGFEPPKMVLD